MKHYKTINEVKRDMPNIVDRINDLKLFFDIATMQLEQMEKWGLNEFIYPDRNYGWWTTLKAYAETYKNQMRYLAEIEYLDGLLKRIPNYKDQNI